MTSDIAQYDWYTDISTIEWRLKITSISQRRTTFRSCCIMTSETFDVDGTPTSAVGKFLCRCWLISESYHFISYTRSGKTVGLCLVYSLVGPTNFGGWSYRLTAVCLSVRPSVCPEFFSETVHMISLIFCIKLAIDKWKKWRSAIFKKSCGFWSIIQVWIIKFLWFCIF